MNTTRLASRGGFSLLELLVAVTITVLVMSGVSICFDAVSRAIRTGIAITDTTAASRLVLKQMRNDFEMMVNPSAGGMLAIVTHEPSTNRAMTRDDIIGNTLRTYKVRTDQILFVRHRGDLQPVVPASTSGNSYAPPSNVAAAHVRVWYGHAARTKADGTDAGRIDAGTPNVANASDPETYPNFFAYNWVLGRHAMFLADPKSNPGGVIADSAHSDGNVTGYSTLPSIAAKNYMSLADIARQSLQDIVADLTASPSNITNYLYLGNNQLRVCPVPVFDRANNRAFDNWQIAQMHTMFVDHVSEITVDFAGDFDGDGKLDVYAANDTANGKYKDAVRWYGHADSGDTNLTALSSKGLRITSGGDYNVFFFEPFKGREWNSATNKWRSIWPEMVRIRLRLHDHQGRLTDAGAPQNRPGQVVEHIIRIPNE